MSDIIRLNKIVAVNCYDISPDFNLESHSHGDWEFLYVDSGTLCYTVCKNQHTLSRGEIVFHKPGESHATQCDGVHSASFFNIIFSSKSRAMQCFAGKSMKVPKSLLPILSALISECERTYFVSGERLKKLLDAPSDGEQFVKELTELFLLSLRRHILNTAYNVKSEEFHGKEQNFSTDAVTDYLSKQLSSNISLDKLAAHFYCGKTFLCTQFKKRTGKSVIDCFLDMKIEKAKIILREESAAIQTISESLGFSSPEYFSRIFKKRTGFSPTEFRNMLITKRIQKRL